jgi:hypothetical protein
VGKTADEPGDDADDEEGDVDIDEILEDMCVEYLALPALTYICSSFYVLLGGGSREARNRRLQRLRNVRLHELL